MKIKPYEFEPDYAIPPGETIKELLIENKITHLSFAKQMKLPLGQITNLLNGNCKISESIAHKLEKIFNITFEFWLTLEENYRKTLTRLNKIQ